MKKFNLCVIKPPGYPHSAAFEELVDLVRYGLVDLGHQALVSHNQIRSDATNLLIGCHLLSPAMAQNTPDDTIVLNTEPIFADDTRWKPIILDWCRRFPVWDYSQRNVEYFRTQGIERVQYLPLGFHRKLQRIETLPTEKIDVLFYGFVNDRRRQILEQLTQAGLEIKVLTGVYGRERDKLIARSKTVLNLHYYQSKIFEVVRVFYLMCNAKAVVCEVNQDTALDQFYLDGIAAATYEELTATCCALVADTHRRQQLQQQALQTIRKLPQAAILERLLTDLDSATPTV